MSLIVGNTVEFGFINRVVTVIWPPERDSSAGVLGPVARSMVSANPG